MRHQLKTGDTIFEPTSLSPVRSKSFWRITLPPSNSHLHLSVQVCCRWTKCRLNVGSERLVYTILFGIVVSTLVVVALRTAALFLLQQRRKRVMECSFPCVLINSWPMTGTISDWRGKVGRSDGRGGGGGVGKWGEGGGGRRRKGGNGEVDWRLEG